jgi:hypothetical protein
MTSNEPVGLFKFGGNEISADSTGKFTIKLVNGGEWFLDVDEIGRLDKILAEFEQGVKERIERVFWRTNGAKVIQVAADSSKVYLVEGGTKSGYFYLGEVPPLRQNIRILTTDGAPYGRSIRLLNVVEENRVEEIVTIQEVPLNNRNSKSPLVVEREFTREAARSVNIETSFGIGFDYYIFLNLERHFSVKREDKITERVMVRMEAQPGEVKIYTIIWKEVWRTGYAEFDLGARREKVPFRLKSGLEPEIKQETLA